MSRLIRHFEERAAELALCASLEVIREEHGATTHILRPHAPRAVGVVMWLGNGVTGTVRLDDPASGPAELGDDEDMDVRAIDYFIDVAREGRVVAFDVGRGGCLEVVGPDGTMRTWMNAVPWPGWRRRAVRVAYPPYR